MSVVSLDAVGEASWQRHVHPGGGLRLRGSIELVEGGVIAETSWGSTLLMSVVSLDAVVGWQRHVHPGGGLGLRGSIEPAPGGVIAETRFHAVCGALGCH